ncbi:MAG TPA: DinB family protein [Tepidisphaeraceae bacterium]|jgi:uncharacterized damage-inducible protein DinB
MTTNESILGPLMRSQAMLQQMVSPFTAEQWLHRPVSGANCPAWIVGHLCVVERIGCCVAAGREPPLPDPDFEKRYARDDYAPKAARYEDVEKLLPTFDQYRGVIVDAVARMPLEKFSQPLKDPHPLFKNVGEMMAFLPMHTMLHLGQLSTIRRSLGYPPLF